MPHIEDLNQLIENVPADTITSRTFLREGNITAVLFAFAVGEELSEHTTPQTAILHFLSGEADLTLGGEAHQAQAGTWVHMPPGMPHSVKARTPVRMLLTMIKAD
jgi:quercetin dioxygenase-like cupin family protein